jgi:hypothetical protein
MGSSSSSPMSAHAETHEQVFNKNEYTRMIMDELLNYMIKQLSVRDLLHMSKESECKKYVLFKANAIYQHFYELRVFPERDARGLLTFRRVEDLVNPKGEQEKERQSLCLIVAYFYTRIFQIYGALALTLIDDMNAMTSSGIMTTFPKGTNARLMTPGRYPQASYYGKGGAIQLLPSSPPSSSVPLKNFDWIRSFLRGDVPLSNGYETRYSGTSDNNGTVQIKIEDQLLDDTKPGGKTIFGTPPPTSYQYATCFITIPSANQWNKLEFFTRISPEEIKVKLGKLTFKNIEKEDIIVSHFEHIIFKINRVIANGKQTYVVANNISDVSEFMANLLSKVIVYLKDAITERKDKIYNYGTRSNYGARGYQSERGISEEGITSHLKVEKMIDNLTTRRPLGHCIARALQLLKTEPFPNQSGVSQICSVAFAGKSTERIGLPKSGKALSDHPGLFALANLFYDTIMIGSPNLIIGKNKVDGRSTFEDYVAFMTTLSNQYAMGDRLTPEEMEQKGLSGIINKRDEKVCTSPDKNSSNETPFTDEIPLTPETTTKVHEIVKYMFRKQVKHAENCNIIINMLFTITINPTTKKPTMFKLNDNLINRGFPELERINREARKILVDYYTDCENKYNKGMGLVWQEKDNKEKAAEQAKIKEEANKKQALQVQMNASAAELKKEQDLKARVKAEFEKEEAAKNPRRIPTPLERQMEAAKLATAKKEEENAKFKKDVQARSAIANAELKREQEATKIRKMQQEEARLMREKEIRNKLIQENINAKARGKPPVGK